MIQRYEREMSISHQDFYRLLPIALKNIEYEIVNNNQINAVYAGGKIEILPGKEHKRKIASLELPVLYIVFTFKDISAKDIQQFFDEFSRVYQRGGG
jgi:hypothetical protein